jgi:hypothetical protein
MHSVHAVTRFAISALLVLAAACKDDDPEEGDADTGNVDDVDLPAGSTAIVVVLNPVANDGHTEGVPASRGDARDAIVVAVAPGGMDTSDASGLAIVAAEPGPAEILLPAGDDRVALALEIVAAGDVYDAPIAWDDAAAEFYAHTPIRYAVGEGAGTVLIDPGTPISDIEDALTVDEQIVVLRPGRYEGDIEIRGRDVLLFGEGFSESAVTIGGSIHALGEAVRLRGLTIEGDVSAEGNNFGMSFCVVIGNASITGNGGAFLRNSFCGDASVPSSSATLLDNAGVSPLSAPPIEICDPESDTTGP